jgi:hypothetical protein
MIVIIYQNDNGIPGTEIYRSSHIPVQWEHEGENKYCNIILPEPFILPEPGKYWISIAGVYDATVTTILEIYYNSLLIFLGPPKIGTDFKFYDKMGIFGEGAVWLEGSGSAPNKYSMYFAIEGRHRGEFDGLGTEQNPYIIYTHEELALLATLVNDGNETYNAAYYKLANNLDLSAYGEDFNNGKGWIKIGTQENPFYGHFDGDNHIITGLYYNDPTKFRAGLFGFILEGSVKNLGIENGNVTGADCTGGMIGGIDYGSVTNCWSSGKVSGTYAVGGLIGGTEGGDIKYCYSMGEVHGDSESGGFLGKAFKMYKSVTIINCYSTSKVTGNFAIGGIIGSADICEIIDCVALNPSVQADNAAGRIIGDYITCQLENNIAWNGMLNIDDAAEALSLAGLGEESDFHTLAGFVLYLAGELPAAGDSFKYRDYKFTVKEMDGNRIGKILISNG